MTNASLSLLSLFFMVRILCYCRQGRRRGGSGGHAAPPLFRLSTYFVPSVFFETGVTHRRFQCLAIALRCTRPLSTELPPPQYPLSRHVNSFQYTSSFCKTCTVGLHASYVASVSVLTLWLSDSLSQCVAGCVLTAHNAHFWNKRIIILKKTTYSSRWNCFYLSLNLSPFVPFFFPPGIGYHLFKLAPLYIRSRHVVCNPWRAPYVCNI